MLATVIVLPTLLLSFWLVLQFAFVMHAKHVAQAAAQDAAAAAAAGSGDASSTAAGLMARSAGGFTSNVGVGVSATSTRVTVTVTANVVRIFPFGSWNVAASGSAPIEQFVPQPDRP